MPHSAWLQSSRLYKCLHRVCAPQTFLKVVLNKQKTYRNLVSYMGAITWQDWAILGMNSLCISEGHQDSHICPSIRMHTKTVLTALRQHHKGTRESPKMPQGLPCDHSLCAFSFLHTKWKYNLEMEIKQKHTLPKLLAIIICLFVYHLSLQSGLKEAYMILFCFIITGTLRGSLG